MSMAQAYVDKIAKLRSILKENFSFEHPAVKRIVLEFKVKYGRIDCATDEFTNLLKKELERKT